MLGGCAVVPVGHHPACVLNSKPPPPLPTPPLTRVPKPAVWCAPLPPSVQDSYGRYLDEGFQGTALTGINEFGDQAPVWRAIDARYDQCVGNCDCIPERDQPDVSFTVHFSCIQGVNKPGGYATEKEFGEAMLNSAPSCTRYWFWHVWCVPAWARGREGRWVALGTRPSLRPSGSVSAPLPPVLTTCAPPPHALQVREVQAGARPPARAVHRPRDPWLQQGVRRQAPGAPAGLRQLAIVPRRACRLHARDGASPGRRLQLGSRDPPGLGRSTELACAVVAGTGATLDRAAATAGQCASAGRAIDAPRRPPRAHAQRL